MISQNFKCKIFYINLVRLIWLTENILLFFFFFEKPDLKPGTLLNQKELMDIKVYQNSNAYRKYFTFDQIFYCETKIVKLENIFLKIFYIETYRALITKAKYSIYTTNNPIIYSFYYYCILFMVMIQHH